MTTPAEINRRNREFYGQSPVSPPPRPYEQRLVAYIDIIGWTNACQIEGEHANVSTVAQILSELSKNSSKEFKLILKATPGICANPVHQKMEVVTFSDNLAISTSVDVDCSLFFKFISSMCRQLLDYGFLTRGGATVGQLYHVENMIFGPALIDAVNLEKEAVYPRIVCSPKLIEYVRGSLQLPTFIIDDQLGRPILNILSSIKQSNPISWQVIAQKIENTLIEMTKNSAPEKNLEKWRFMRGALPMMVNAAPA